MLDPREMKEIRKCHRCGAIMQWRAKKRVWLCLECGEKIYAKEVLR